MLYVNLIEERLKGRALMGAVVRFGALGLVVVGLAIGTLLFLQLLRARDLGHKMDAVRAEMKELEPDAEECKRVIVKTGEIAPLWELADGVTVSQQTWGMVMRALSECRPLSGMISLEAMDSQASEKEKLARLSVRGLATSEYAVSDYQTALNDYRAAPDAPPLFDADATKLIEVTATTREGLNIRSFGLELGLAPAQGGG